MRNDFFYEYRPFAFMALGAMAALFSLSAMMTLAAWSLVGCSVFIVHARLRHRGIIK